jgi:hypothetical protein
VLTPETLAIQKDKMTNNDLQNKAIQWPKAKKKGQGNTVAKRKKGRNDKQWLSLHRQLMTE